MTNWVALLRGVNVGGITIRSADLAELFAGLGLEGVRTVLASGNVLFRSDDGARSRDALKARIEKALRDRFDYEAWILLRTAEEIAATVAGYPFDEDPAHHAYAVFCVDDATHDELLGLAAADELVAPGPGAVYWRAPKGTTLDAPFGRALSKAAFKARTTNRNLNTLRKLAR